VSLKGADSNPAFFPGLEKGKSTVEPSFVLCA
jgi:hypothetical protein